MDGERVGYLAWYSVPDVAVPYADLTRLAEETGFPSDCVPVPPRPRNAWEKATSTTSRGIAVQPPAELARSISQQYGVFPRVRLVTRVVCSRAPILVRHLVREAVISVPGAPTSKQLDLGTVAVLKFDTISNESNLLVVEDPHGYINGNVGDIVQEMDQEMVRLMTNAVGSEIRYGIRRMLHWLYSVEQRGGVYFVPAAAPAASDRLTAMKNFINGLEDWKTTDAPFCNVVTLIGDTAYTEIRDSVLLSVEDQYTRRIRDLAEMVKPVIEGRARGKVAERINRNAIEEWRAIYDGLGAYRMVLRDELAQLSEIFRWMTQAVEQAAAQSWSRDSLAGVFSDLAGDNETVRRIL